ncbi:MULTISPECIES: DUF2971 domain-containing protein [Serratia]|uniref:DUF2971 domain-containing protein n=1 Tax=Serratia TaxID=613 RepID=UPI0015594870
MKYGKSFKLNVLIGDFIKTLGVFSASKNARNALFWSHYGNSHKGICLGFDTQRTTSVFCRRRIVTGRTVLSSG